MDSTVLIALIAFALGLPVGWLLGWIHCSMHSWSVYAKLFAKE